MRIKLTPAKLAKAAPAKRPYEIHDAEVRGLLVRVQPSGVKSFIVSWRRGRRKVIGRVGVHTIEQMRLKAKRIVIDAEEHGEPSIAERKRAGTLGEFYIDHFKSHAKAHHKDADGNLKAIETEFGHLFDRPLASVSPFDFEKYRQKKLKAGVKPQTINRHFDRLHALLAKAVDWKHLSKHPLEDLKRAKVDEEHRVRFLSDDEEKRLRKALAARDAKMRRERESANKWRKARGYPLFPEVAEDGFGDHLTPMVLVSMNTGMRRGELRQIAWADVDLSHGVVTIRGGYAKSRRTRHVPLNAEAVDVLHRWKRQTGEAERVFGIARVDKAWKALLKVAKVSEFRWHDLRHHFASRLVMAGVDLNTVRELLGHADLSMTLRYAHLAPEHKAAAVARLVA
ncbi:MAG: site-specific integrase [Burkholderiales bacterium]|nr:site-specific integrase [Burkholderiales bacterium]